MATKVSKELNLRILHALNDADEEFWNVIANHFPEATSGDMMPGQDAAFSDAAHDVIKIWLQNNTDLIEEGEDV